MSEARKAQRTVCEMLADGKSLEEIEAFIEGLSISEDERSALWLLAWNGKLPHVRENVIQTILTSASS